MKTAAVRPMHVPLANVQIQIEAAAIAVAKLQALGCRVLSVMCREHGERPLIHIAEAGPLESWLDAHVGTLSAEPGAQWIEGRCTFRECDVIWLIQRVRIQPAGAAA